MAKIPVFTSVRIRSRKPFAVLNKKFQEDQAVKELLRPENDFLYEPRSKEQHLKYIDNLTKTHASKKV